MIARICLGMIAFIGFGVGVWALAWPLDFYGAFPGCGRTWVSLDGPYNEHLVRDVGALNLCIGALAAFGLLLPRSVEPRVVGISTTFYALPHFIYHSSKLELYLPLDQTPDLGRQWSGARCVRRSFLSTSAGCAYMKAEPILITGAAGSLGSAVHRIIAARGVACRGLSRTAMTASGLSYVEVDLLTGAGVEEAVRGSTTIIHCATNPEKPDDDVVAADQLMDVARRHDARIVFTSVAGIEKAAESYHYYRCKLEVEARLKKSGLAYAIARATQFHPLIAYMMMRLEFGPVLIVPANA